MNDWNESDFRLFVGNLGREVTTEILANQFRQRYPSFTKARVVENKMYKGSQGYGFVAFSDPLEGIKADEGNEWKVMWKSTDEGDEERVAKERCKEYILGRIVFGFT